MTVAQLKRSMDSRFRSVDRRFQRMQRSMDARFDQLEKTLRTEIRESEERTRRHFDVVAERLHDDMRKFAEAIGVHSDRLGDHESRLRRLEQRRPT